MSIVQYDMNLYADAASIVDDVNRFWFNGLLGNKFFLVTN